MNKRSAAGAVACVLAVLGPAARADEAAREAVKAVVRSAYVEGVHVRGDGALMRAGFHPDFRMFLLRDGALSQVTLEEWIGRIEKGGKERTTPRPEVRHEFTLVDVTGNAAVARVELHIGGKHTFTDYLSLYRFADGWKIVAKIFHAYPK